MIASQRFEFSAAHSLPRARAEREWHLHGHNYELWVAVHGEPDAAELKRIVAGVLERYDNRLLDKVIASESGPTVEAVAEALWADLAPLIEPSWLARVRLAEDGGPAAEVTETGTRTLIAGLFPAAHRTHIPTYSDEANRELFGICNNPAGHGHNYRIIVESEAASEVAAEAVREALAEFDHRNLSADIADLAGRNVTTEALARLLWGRLARRLPNEGALRRVRVYELPDFFAETTSQAAALGRVYIFAAAHQPGSTADVTGHTYRVEVTVSGNIDEETNLLMNLADLDRLAWGAVGPLDGRCLDEDIDYFKGGSTTGGDVLAYLWRELFAQFGTSLARVGLSETRNSCFEIET